MIFLLAPAAFIRGGGVYSNNYGNAILISNFCHGYIAIPHDISYIFHCYFSFAFFLQFVAFRCRNALIAASDWLVLPILDAVFSLFSLSRLRS